MKRKDDGGSLKPLSTSVEAGSPRDESVRLADVSPAKRDAADTAASTGAPTQLTFASELTRALSLFPKNQPQKLCIGKFRATSLTHDGRVQRWDHKKALITRAEGDDRVRRCSLANADVAPARALPRQVEFFFNVDLAGVWRRSIQPKSQTVGWVCARADERLSQQAGRDNLAALIISAP